MKIELPPSRLDFLIREWLCEELHRIDVEKGNIYERKEIEAAKNIIKRTGKLKFITTDEGTSVEISLNIPNKKKKKSN